MTEREIVDEIWSKWPTDGGDASVEVIELSAEAVQLFPDSAELWRMRGNLVNLAPLEYCEDVMNPDECYHKSLALEPRCAETWEDLGYYLDSCIEDFPEAEKAFLMAIECGAGSESYYGLARVRTERGDASGALASLEPDLCPYCDDPEILKLREEILRGLWSPTPD